MVVIGAKGFAKEVLEILHQNEMLDDLCFFDNINNDIPDKLFDSFPIYKTENEIKTHFENKSKDFTIGIGNPQLRKKLYEKFNQFGGEFTSVISPKADIGHYDNKIYEGCIITSGVKITNSVTIGKGVLINLNSTIGHDTVIEDFVEICPSVSISGNCIIEENVFIGTGAIVLPKVKIGANSVIAAGAVITKNIPANVMVAGVPAKIIKTI